MDIKGYNARARKRRRKVLKRTSNKLPTRYRVSDKLSNKDFVTKSKDVHGGKYDYSKSECLIKSTKVVILCPIHGRFRCTAIRHMNGLGCPKCTETKGELKVRRFLERNEIKYIQEYTLPGTLYRLDFYLPDLNIAIEYDGAQHFQPVRKWGGMDGLNKTISRDYEKDIICNESGIELIRIAYLQYFVLEKYIKHRVRMLYPYVVKVRGKQVPFRSFLALCRYFKLPKSTSLQ